MKRTAVNPWTYSLAYGYNQGELIEAPSRVLFCAGQTALDGDGQVQHAGNMRAQMELAVANLEMVLKEAGMTLANIVRLTVYTTDVDATLGCYDALIGPLGAAGVTPAQTLLGVARLAFPDLMVELEATAVA